MTSPRQDPYLWIHLAGLATVPVWLDLCLAGLAVGDPVVPPWLELTTLGWVGTVPILWMQLTRPFYIFSVPGLAVRPDKLENDRCKFLAIQRSWWVRLIVLISAVSLFYGLFWLYQLAPIAASMTPFAAQPRAIGWLICALSFFLANLFVQVPASVVPLLMLSPGQVASVQPYSSSEILSKFTVFGLRVARLLPSWSVETPQDVGLPEMDPVEMVDSHTEMSSASEEVLETILPLEGSVEVSSDEPSESLQPLITVEAEALPETVANAPTAVEPDTAPDIALPVINSENSDSGESAIASQSLDETHLTKILPTVGGPLTVEDGHAGNEHDTIGISSTDLEIVNDANSNRINS